MIEMHFLAGLRQEAEILEQEGDRERAGKCEELAYYIESLEHTIKEMEKAAWKSGAPLTSIDVFLVPIKMHKKRMNEWQYGTWSPGPDGKRPMTGILDMSRKE
jgi:hypothetical protein